MNASTFAQIVDAHRNTGHWNSATDVTVECLCGHESVATFDEFLDTPLDRENSPLRVAQKRHAEHVGSHLASVQVTLDAHRIASKWDDNNRVCVGCVCGHDSFARYDEFLTVPMGSEQNPQREAERRHAEHVEEAIRGE